MMGSTESKTIKRSNINSMVTTQTKTPWREVVINSKYSVVKQITETSRHGFRTCIIHELFVRNLLMYQLLLRSFS